MPYLNKEVNLNLILWQQINHMIYAFPGQVETILSKKYFADVTKTDRPFSVFGYVDNGKYYGGGWDGVDAQNVCGFSNIQNRTEEPAHPCSETHAPHQLWSELLLLRAHAIPSNPYDA